MLVFPPFDLNFEKMELADFIKKFATLFPKDERGSIAPETAFREIPSWNSLIALSVIALVEDEYGILLRGNDIRSTETVRELFESVRAKKS